MDLMSFSIIAYVVLFAANIVMIFLAIFNDSDIIKTLIGIGVAIFGIFAIIASFKADEYGFVLAIPIIVADILDIVYAFSIDDDTRQIVVSVIASIIFATIFAIAIFS